MLLFVGHLFYRWIFQPFAGLPLSWHIDRLREPFFIITGPDIHWGEILVGTWYRSSTTQCSGAVFIPVRFNPFDYRQRHLQCGKKFLTASKHRYFCRFVCDMTTSFTAGCKWKKNILCNSGESRIRSSDLWIRGFVSYRTHNLFELGTFSGE